MSPFTRMLDPLGLPTPSTQGYCTRGRRSSHQNAADIGHQALGLGEQLRPGGSGHRAHEDGAGLHFREIGRGHASWRQRRSRCPGPLPSRRGVFHNGVERSDLMPVALQILIDRLNDQLCPSAHAALVAAGAGTVSRAQPVPHRHGMVARVLGLVLEYTLEVGYGSTLGGVPDVMYA